MYRILIEQLKHWKEKKDRLPLILRGARQVGKTWLLKEFGRTCFKDVLYINFETDKNMNGLFEGSIDAERIINALSAVHGKKIIPESTLIIFDEVQEVPRALTSLKYFAEDAPEYHLCCAGSLLGIALHKGTSFPVGKVEFLTLLPLTFKEYLLAIKEDKICDYLEKTNIATGIEVFKEELVDCLKQYYIIGGMPASVRQWVDSRDYSAVADRQNAILDAYSNDFSKHAPADIVPRINYLWSSIPSQLSRENKKFTYGLVRAGARAREYETAILWLVDCGLLRKVSRISTPGIPLKAYLDLKAFKLFHLDVGLLGRMSGLNPEAIVRGTELFEEFKGALSEQFVLQELEAALKNTDIYYWTSEGIAEIDFIISGGVSVLPIEVKSGKSLKSQSLRVYREKFKPKISIRVSMENLKYDDGLFNIPFYALWNLENYMANMPK